MESPETMLASEIKVCRPRAGGEPGAMLASEKQERSSLNETQSGWIAPSSAREWIDRSVGAVLVRTTCVGGVPRICDTRVGH